MKLSWLNRVVDTYFRYKYIFYKQKEGLSIGGSLGPMYLTFL